MNLGQVGIWTAELDMVPQAQAQEHVVELEELGYGAVWIPEAVGREALTASALLLSGSSRIVVATGIASIWARDPMAMSGAHKTLTEAVPDRFLLGMGVSHQPAVDYLRGHTYAKPLTHMRQYLDAMDASLFMAAEPSVPPQRVLAALGPKMLELAATRAAGAHPYFVPVEHTTLAREALGEGPLLCVEQAVVLDRDPDGARAVARTHMALYLSLPNYTNNLRRLGWTDADLDDGGSDALVDAIVAWGDLEAVAERVADHHARGATHVCLQVLSAEPGVVPTAAWRALAPALVS
jgi:probable F420-dependent oxidoreductase